MWSNEIIELENYFNSISVPEEIRLNDYEYIFDTKLFIKNTLASLKFNNGNKHFKGDLIRLIQLKCNLENTK